MSVARVRTGRAGGFNAQELLGINDLARRIRESLAGRPREEQLRTMASMALGVWEDLIPEPMLSQVRSAAADGVAPGPPSRAFAAEMLRLDRSVRGRVKAYWHNMLNALLAIGSSSTSDDPAFVRDAQQTACVGIVRGLLDLTPTDRVTAVAPIERTVRDAWDRRLNGALAEALSRLKGAPTAAAFRGALETANGVPAMRIFLLFALQHIGECDPDAVPGIERRFWSTTLAYAIMLDEAGTRATDPDTYYGGSVDSWPRVPGLRAGKKAFNRDETRDRDAPQDRRDNPGPSQPQPVDGVRISVRARRVATGVREITVLARRGRRVVGSALAQVGERGLQQRWRMNTNQGGWAGEEWNHFPPAEVIAYVQGVEVVPEERGRGIGRALAAAVVKASDDRKATRQWLSVAPMDEETNDHDLVRLYSSLGFKPMPGQEHEDGPKMVRSRPEV